MKDFDKLLDECRETAKERVDEAIPKQEPYGVFAFDSTMDDANITDLNRYFLTEEEAVEYAKDLQDLLPDMGVGVFIEVWKRDENGTFGVSGEPIWKSDILTKESKVTEQDDEEDEGLPEPPEEVKEPDTRPIEMRKEYLGKREDTHYYFVTKEGAEGEVEDFLIVDQEGVKRYSARDHNLEISEEKIADFIIQAIQDVDIQQIERSIFMKYILPKLLKEEAPEEEVVGEPEEKPEKEKPEEEPTKIPPEEEEEELPRESKKVNEEEYNWEVTYEYKLALEGDGEPDDQKCIDVLSEEFSIGNVIPQDFEVTKKRRMFPRENKLSEMKVTRESKKIELTEGVIDDIVSTIADTFRKTGMGSIYRRDVEEWIADYDEEIADEVISKLEKDEGIIVENLRRENKLSEMKVTDEEGHSFDVNLVDDGTMDTVISIEGREFRFDPEFSAYWRDEEGVLSEEGLKELALDALANIEEEEYNELVTASAEEEPEFEPPDETKESKNRPGKRDGTGPAKGSYQRAKYGSKGKRKQAGEKCPEEDKNQSGKRERKIAEQVSPEVGGTYTYTDPKGRSYTGKVTNIARMRTGAVLAYMDVDGKRKGFPVTKYGVWKKSRESKSSRKESNERGNGMSKVNEQGPFSLKAIKADIVDWVYNVAEKEDLIDLWNKLAQDHIEYGEVSDSKIKENKKIEEKLFTKQFEDLAVGADFMYNGKRCVKHSETEYKHKDKVHKIAPKTEVEAIEKPRRGSESKANEATEGTEIDVYTSADDETPQKATMVSYVRPGLDGPSTAKLGGKTIKIVHDDRSGKWIIQEAVTAEGEYPVYSMIEGEVKPFVSYVGNVTIEDLKTFKTASEEEREDMADEIEALTYIWNCVDYNPSIGFDKIISTLKSKGEIALEHDEGGLGIAKSKERAKELAIRLEVVEGKKGRPLKKGAARRSRGDCVFPYESPKVTDNADHFPINSENQARNALARANQYKAAPKWYKGTLDSLVKAVAKAVKKKYPDIKVTKAAEIPGKGPKESKVFVDKEHESIDERKHFDRLNYLLNR